MFRLILSRTAKTMMLTVLVVVLVFPLSTNRVEAQTTVVSIKPERVRTALNTVFTVDINISDVTDLYGYELMLWFKNSVLQATKAERPAGHFLTPVDPDKIFVAKWEIKNDYNSTHGRIWLSVILITPEVGKTGSGILVRLTFKGIREGITPLTLDPMKLSDSNADSIDSIVNDGLVAVGNVMTVPDDYSTIQKAINSAYTGDRIYVRPGTYFENVIVNKTVSLIGEATENTFIDGGGKGNVIIVSANGVEIRKFTIQNGGKQPWTNYGACIQLQAAYSNCSIRDSVLRNSTLGVEINCYNTTVANSVIKENYKGISMPMSGGNNTITGNTIIDSIWYGLEIIYNNNGSTVFHNSFISNSQYQFYAHAYITGTVCVWDNGVEGNYWSNYTGTDTDGDGTSETPHIIDVLNRDNHPLMSPYMQGDVNHDATIDIFDCVLAALAFGSVPSDPQWNPHCDVNLDNTIDIFDMVTIALNFGKQWTNP